jgi:tRNA pseudouridine38-40 synthase
MRNVMLVLEYDGTGYHGWQGQARGERTVQSVVLEAVEKLTGRRPSLVAAGRTDAGVHALGQVACFRTASTLHAATIKRALNARLPADIRVVSAADVGDRFHPARDALSKRYSYLIANSGPLSPFCARYAWHIPVALDAKVMEEGGRRLLGTHDFRAFMGAGSSVKDTVRELAAVSVEEREGIGFLGFTLAGRFIRIRVEGSGFLRHMVRNMVGTLVEVARGRRSPESISDIIRSKDRKVAGPTAPARGLFLEEVVYRL